MSQCLANVVLVTDAEQALVAEFTKYVKDYFDTEWKRWPDATEVPPVKEWADECVDAFVSTREQANADFEELKTQVMDDWLNYL